MKARKAAFLTQRLSLTPEKAQQFWPVYNEYEQKMHELRTANREVMKPSGSNQWTEEQAAKNVDAFIDFRKNEVALMAEYHEKFKKVLPAAKVARLYRAEEAFKRKVLEELRSRRAGPKGGPPRGPNSP